jgi:hypothetical protein
MAAGSGDQAGTRNLGRAIRSWAAEDKDVARIVASVDGRRVARFAKLLAEAGVEGERALHRAAFLYWAYLGQAVVMNPRHSSTISSTCLKRERPKTTLSTYGPTPERTSRPSAIGQTAN